MSASKPNIVIPKSIVAPIVKTAICLRILIRPLVERFAVDQLTGI